MLSGIVYAGDVPVFRRQVIQVPLNGPSWIWPRWKDINKDGLLDLLALVQSERTLFIYNQNNSGFPSVPSQTIKFPDDTAWFAIHDVSGHPGDEMLISTGNGLAYYRQDNGTFEKQLQKLVEAKQVFTGNGWPHFISLTKQEGNSTITVPVIFSDHTVLYEFDEHYQFTPGEKVELEFSRSIEEQDWTNWSLGAKESSRLCIRTTAAEKSEDNESKTPEENEYNEYITTVIEKIRKDSKWYEYGIEKKDINADGREDLVLWQFTGIDPRMTVMVFVRRQDDKLPEQPSQVLRCRGIPIQPDYNNRHVSLLGDVNNDGLLDIILAKLKIKPLSASSLFEAISSKGMDWVLTVRLFKKPKGYSKQADFRMDITTMLPMYGWAMDFINFGGDFNADDRKDLIIKRSPTRSEVFLSSVSNGFFDRKAKLQFELPTERRWSTKDLNGDGISDVFVIGYRGDGQLTLFLSEPANRKKDSR